MSKHFISGLQNILARSARPEMEACYLKPRRLVADLSIPAAIRLEQAQYAIRIVANTNE